MNSIILWLVEDFGGSVEGSDVGVEAYDDVIDGHSNRKWAALLHMGNKQWVSCASEERGSSLFDNKQQHQFGFSYWL